MELVRLRTCIIKSTKTTQLQRHCAVCTIKKNDPSATIGSFGWRTGIWQGVRRSLIMADGEVLDGFGNRDSKAGCGGDMATGDMLTMTA